MQKTFRETFLIGRQTRERVLHQGACPELRNYGIGSMGLTDAACPYAMVRMKHDCAHLLVCTGGTGRVFAEGRWDYCHPGEAYLSRTGIFHAFQAVPGRRWQFAWVHYSQHRPWHPILPSMSTLSSGDGYALSSAIEGLYREVTANSQPEARPRWIGLIDFYWQQIAQARSRYGRLTKLWEKVDQNLAHPWTIRELAGYVGLSHEHLRRISKAETGHSPIVHVTRLRMNRAVTLLQSTSLKMEAIAEAVGYSNPFAFSSAFRRRMGCPPSRYQG